MRRSADRLWSAALAAALLLAAPAVAGEPASAVHGDWLTEGARAIVRVAPCGERLCGRIVWLWQSRDETGQPMTDRENPDTERRRRPLVGVDLLSGFRSTAPGQWSDGTIYNPEDGRSYKANLRLDSAEEMTVEGCVLFICKKQLWRRAASVCAMR
jgi:Delta7-sterol 5-desaturase